MSLPRKLKYFNVYIDGVGFIGEVSELVLPKLNRKVEEWLSGGMPGSADVDLGVEKMEAEATFGGPIDEILKGHFSEHISGTLIRFVGSFQRDDSGDVDAIEAEMRGCWTEVDFGNWKAGDDTEFKVKASLTYLKVSINNEVVAEVDMIDSLSAGTTLPVDRAYDSDGTRKILSERGVFACIKPLAQRRTAPSFDHFLYRQRNLVERFFNKLKHFRAVATRYALRFTSVGLCSRCEVSGCCPFDLNRGS